jgi:hypothetical protein
MFFYFGLGTQSYWVYLVSPTFWIYTWAEIPFSLVALIDFVGESYFFYSDTLFFIAQSRGWGDALDFLLLFLFIFSGIFFYRVLQGARWSHLRSLGSRLVFSILGFFYCLLLGFLFTVLIDLDFLNLLVFDDQAFFEDAMDTFAQSHKNFPIQPVFVGVCLFGSFWFYTRRFLFWSVLFSLCFFLEDLMGIFWLVIGFREVFVFSRQLQYEYF